MSTSVFTQNENERYNTYADALNRSFKKGIWVDVTPLHFQSKRRTTPATAYAFDANGRILLRDRVSSRVNAISVRTFANHYTSPIHDRIRKPKVEKPNVEIEAEKVKQAVKGAAVDQIRFHRALSSSYPGWTFSDKIDRVLLLINNDVLNEAAIGGIAGGLSATAPAEARSVTVGLSAEEIDSLRQLLQAQQA